MSKHQYNNRYPPFDLLLFPVLLLPADISALQNIKTLLDDSGKLILLVPQYRFLFGSYDKVVNHYRRYSKRQLRDCLDKAGYNVIKFKNFNFFSIPAWWLNSCVFRSKKMSRWQLKIYDLLVPILSIIEKIFPLPGLSVIVVAEKK